MSRWNYKPKRVFPDGDLCQEVSLLEERWAEEDKALAMLTEFGSVGLMFSHYGDFGDIIYSLSAVYDLCFDSKRKAEYYLYPVRGTRALMTKEHAALLLPLIEAQPYIEKAVWSKQSQGVVLDVAQRIRVPAGTLSDNYHNWLDIPLGSRFSPWLTAKPKKIAPIVISRSHRYHALGFPWAKILNRKKGQCVFVGLRKEYDDFMAEFGELDFYPTENFLQLAEVIAGADLFIGNQSAPRAIAEGLKKPVVVEVGPVDDTHFVRSDAWYGNTADFWCEGLVTDLDTELMAATGGRSLLLYEFLTVLRDCVQLTNHLCGDLAELGVYQGGTSKVIKKYSTDGVLHLFDTFKGIPEDDAIPDGYHRKGDFGDDTASLETVKEFLGEENIQYHVGEFPASIKQPDYLKYKFVHVDGDIYQSILAACKYFPSRMLSGGIIVFDDYERPSCPGVKKAILECGLRPEKTAQYQAIVRF